MHQIITYILSVPILNNGSSYFKVDRTFYASGATGNSIAKLSWFAIGRWK